MTEHLVQSAPASNVYIIGAGIAGLLTADALNDYYHSHLAGVALPQIEIIDQAAQVGDKLTRGNGRSMTVTEGLIAAGSTPAGLRQAFATPVAAGGMHYPGFVATEADRQAIAAFIDGAGISTQERIAAIYSPQDMQTDDDSIAVQARNDALLRFGFASVDLWRQFARQNPHIAAKAGLQMTEKFRIYECPDAAARAEAEVCHLNRIGAEFGYSAGRQLTAQAVGAAEPSLQHYLASRTDQTGRFQGAITCQPGGLVHGGLLAQALEQKLQAAGNVTFRLGVGVHGIDLDPAGHITGLHLLEQGMVRQVGTAADRFIFATGGDRLLAKTGLTAQDIFPIAGTTITIPVNEAALRAEIPFCRHSWKHDGIGPLVISPSFSPSDAYLEFLDGLDADSLQLHDPAVQATEYFSPTWVAQQDLNQLDVRCVDPRQPQHFNSACIGPKAGTWDIRIGGLKFYPGREEVLDLDHAGARWAIHHQVCKAIEWMPELMAHVLGRPLTPVADAEGNLSYSITAADLAKLQPWTGGRPMYSHGMAAVGAICDNGYLITGTGSWGMACGTGNAAIVAQLVAGVPKAEIKIGPMAPHWVQDYLRRVAPTRVRAIPQQAAVENHSCTTQAEGQRHTAAV